MQYDFNLGANQSVNFDVKGKFVRYKNGTGPIRVKLNGGGFIDMKPGQGIRAVDFNTVSVQDRSGTGNTGYILAGDYEFTDDTITGTVDMVDGGRTRSLANQAFAAPGMQAAGGAGIYSNVQLYNPVGSGRNVVVESLSIMSSSPGSAGTYITPAAAANLLYLANAKLSGGTQSLAQVRAANTAGNPAVGNQSLMTHSLQASVTEQRRYYEPVVLRPGYGLSIYASTPNTDISVNFEFFEELI